MEKLLITEQARARIKWDVGVPRTPELFHVPNSPFLGEVTQDQGRSWFCSVRADEPLTWRPSLHLLLSPFFLRNRGDDSVIKKGLVYANERGLLL